MSGNKFDLRGGIRNIRKEESAYWQLQTVNKIGVN